MFSMVQEMGMAGTLHSVSRIENGGCGRAIFFNGINSYVEIPYQLPEPPGKGNYRFNMVLYRLFSNPQTLISSYEDGGYRLGI